MNKIIDFRKFGNFGRQNLPNLAILDETFRKLSRTQSAFAGFSAIIAGMDKSVLQTTLIIATIIGAAWTLGGQVQSLDGQ